MKKLISILLVLLILMSSTTLLTSANANENPNIQIIKAQHSVDGITLTVGAGSATHIAYALYRDFTTVYRGFVRMEPDEDNKIKLHIPEQNLWQDVYKFVAWGTDATESYMGSMFTADIELGRLNQHLNNDIIVYQPLEAKNRLATIKTAYANIYSNPKMNDQCGTLRQYNRVYWAPTSNPYIYYVRAYYIDGPATMKREEEAVGKYPGVYYNIQNTHEYTGYVYSAAIESDRPANQLVQDATKIAFTRLDLNGMYSRTRPWDYYWVDSSSLVWWSYKEAGLEFEGTSIEDILWHLSQETADVYNIIYNCEFALDRTYYGSYGYEVIPVRYPETDNIDADLFISWLEPGDILFFNDRNPVYYIETELVQVNNP